MVQKKLLHCNALKAYQQKRKIRNFLPGHKYSLINPFEEEDSNEDDENRYDVRAASTKLDPFQALLYTGKGEKRGREKGEKLPEDPKEAGQGTLVKDLVFGIWYLVFGFGIWYLEKATEKIQKKQDKVLCKGFL